MAEKDWRSQRGQRSFIRFCPQRPTSEASRQRPCDPEIQIDRRNLQAILDSLESFSGE